MTIVFLVADCTSASSRLRVLQYTDLLRQDDVDVIICRTRPSKYLWPPPRLSRSRYSRQLYAMMGVIVIIIQRLLQIVAVVPQADVVVLQKDLLFRTRLRFLERGVFAMARLRRSRVVFDLDDAIYLGTSQRPMPQMSAKVSYLARSADLVLAGSEPIATAQRPHAKSVVVVPTCIMLADRPKRSYARPPDALRLAWVGTSTNARHLDLVAGAIRHLSEQGHVSVEIVTRLVDFPDNVLAGLDVHLTEWDEMAEAAVLQRADVALAPLFDTPWTQAKCGGRLLSYFAAAVPVLASSVGAQAEFVQHDRTGLIATSHAEWITGLCALRDNEDLRRRLGQAGRMFVETHLSARRWYPYWRDQLLGAGAT